MSSQLWQLTRHIFAAADGVTHLTILFNPTINMLPRVVLYAVEASHYVDLANISLSLR
jgi:hypothetical protein